MIFNLIDKSINEAYAINKNIISVDDVLENTETEYDDQQKIFYCLFRTPQKK